jgi:hypothetical protein
MAATTMQGDFHPQSIKQTQDDPVCRPEIATKIEGLRSHPFLN